MFLEIFLKSSKQLPSSILHQYWGPQSSSGFFRLHWDLHNKSSYLTVHLENLVFLLPSPYFTFLHGCSLSLSLATIPIQVSKHVRRLPPYFILARTRSHQAGLIILLQSYFCTKQYLNENYTKNPSYWAHPMLLQVIALRNINLNALQEINSQRYVCYSN